ncbi:TniQ family protein [Paraburkholderia denitrificans]|uniref:TniQ family protein n=1 Tax=Paraburkholderia denitrificans TaxID=694025 RepID=A0ABW0J8Z5_9BURK
MRQPDELLSSWLVRLALAQGCDPLVLTSCLWPHRRVWMTDLDRGMVGETDARGGLSGSEYGDLTLRGAASKVAGAKGLNTAIWPWILAVGCRNRLRHGGLQFCPACLAMDRTPYYRRSWRFAWHTGCFEHDCALLDHCGSCGAVLEPHRLTQSDSHIALCASCKADLRGQSLPAWSPLAANFQQFADEVLQRGMGCYGNELIETTEWFRLTRVIIALLRAAGRSGHQCLVRVFVRVGLDQRLMQSPATGLPLELLPVEERVALLALACQILDAGPDVLADAMDSEGLTRCALLFGGGNAPACLDSLLSRLPARATPHHTKRSTTYRRLHPRIAVQRMVARLRRRVRP